MVVDSWDVISKKIHKLSKFSLSSGWVCVERSGVICLCRYSQIYSFCDVQLDTICLHSPRHNKIRRMCVVHRKMVTKMFTDLQVQNLSSHKSQMKIWCVFNVYQNKWPVTRALDKQLGSVCDVEKCTLAYSIEVQTKKSKTSSESPRAMPLGDSLVGWLCLVAYSQRIMKKFIHVFSRIQFRWKLLFTTLVGFIECWWRHRHRQKSSIALFSLIYSEQVIESAWK